jgi:hypothetical protein
MDFLKDLLQFLCSAKILAASPCARSAAVWRTCGDDQRLGHSAFYLFCF